MLLIPSKRIASHTVLQHYNVGIIANNILTPLTYEMLNTACRIQIYSFF